MTEILSVDPARRGNAENIAAAAALGYVIDPVLDLTVGPMAGFWRKYRPAQLVTNDINPTVEADLHHDLRDMPLLDKSFATVVSDVPYKQNGTSTGRGSSALDARYGVDGPYRRADAVHDLLTASIVTANRLARQYVLVKCQDATSSGRLQPQTYIAWHVATALGMELADLLHVFGARPQPDGRRQVSARHNYSTLLVFKVGR